MSVNKKNIAFIIYTLSGGGAEKVVSSISDKLVKYYNVKVFIFENKIDFNTQAEIVNLNLPSVSGMFGKLTTFYRRIKTLKKAKIKNNIDVSISFLPLVNLYNILSRVNENVVISLRSYNDIDDLKYHKKIFNKYLVKHCDYIISCSKLITNEVIKKFRGVENKIVTIYNPIDYQKITSKLSENIEDRVSTFLNSGDVIITVGKIIKYKGYSELLDAFHIYKTNYNINAKLLIIGRDFMNGQLHNKILNLKLEKDVLLLGFSDNPYKYLNKAKIFVLSSYYEGFPNVVIEAMACGLPIVSVDCPSGPKEILSKSDLYKTITTPIMCDFGVLCPPITENTEKNIHYLAEGIDIAMKNRCELCQKSENRVKDFYINVIVNEYKEMLDEILREELN